MSVGWLVCPVQFTAVTFANPKHSSEGCLPLMLTHSISHSTTVSTVNILLSHFNLFLAVVFLSSPFTVIQDVDNTSLEGQYQSFASLMEQRLAELFVLAGQHGTRFRRATAVGSFTVQVRHLRSNLVLVFLERIDRVTESIIDLETEFI